MPVDLRRKAPNEEPTIYLITAYRPNHLRRNVPVDARFRESSRNFVYYFVDEEGAVPGFPGRAISEIDLHPEIQLAGKLHFAEWTFLLTEYLRPFASYPLFMISTRFYEKNARLPLPLDQLWDQIFQYLRLYGYGYLPSYDRDFHFIDYVDYYKRSLIGITLEAIALVNRIYKVDFIYDCRFFSDFFCNYIGFLSRHELKNYVEFYLPIINYFFDDKFNEVRAVRPYVQRLSDIQRGSFYAEKPFTLLLEMISHLFFYKNSRKFFGLKHDGFYEIDERLATGRLLEKIPLSGGLYEPGFSM